MNSNRSRGGRFAAWLLLFAAAAVSGCMTLETVEERQVRTDRERMQRGEPLRFHKDTIELSEHAMALRMNRGGGKPAASSPPPNGASYEFRSPHAGGQGYGVVPAGAMAPEGTKGEVSHATAEQSW